MLVKDLMKTNLITLEIPGTRADLLQRVKEHHHLGYPCVKAGTKELVGIITRTNLIEKPDETQLAMLMTRDPVTLPPDVDMNDAIRLMAEKRIRRIPVTDNGDLLGIVTIHDVIGRIIASSGLDIEIKDIIAKTITAVWQDTPMTVLRKVLSLARIKAVPVLDDDANMVGIVGLDDIISLSEEITSSSTSSGTATGEFHTGSWDAMDVIKIEKKSLSVPNIPVKDIMASGVVSAFESASVTDIAQKMRRHNFSQLPVVNAHGTLIGMIYDRQILAAYAQQATL